MVKCWIIAHFAIAFIVMLGIIVMIGDLQRENKKLQNELDQTNEKLTDTCDRLTKTQTSVTSHENRLNPKLEVIEQP